MSIILAAEYKRLFGSPKRRRRGNKNQPPWHLLDYGTIERILSKLPIADFFRYRSVCKRWSSLNQSPTFLMASGEALRNPWFYMLEPKFPTHVIYDTDTKRWRHIDNMGGPTDSSGKSTLPVAASGALMCFRSSNRDLIVCNVITGSSRRLPALEMGLPILAIAMHMKGSAYKVIVAYGRTPNFGIRVVSSVDYCWKDMRVKQKIKIQSKAGCSSQNTEEGDDLNQYVIPRTEMIERRRELLRRTGIIQRSSAKELSGVATVCQDGREVIHFLNCNGRVIACDPCKGIMYMYPQILPSGIEYSVDLVECRGRVLLVVLQEMMETASLRVWHFDPVESQWKQVMAMPPAMSQAFYGKKADINCVGHGDLIMICITSHRFHSVVMCNLKEHTWEDLPKCSEIGTRGFKKFISAYCFEPRIEVAP